MMGFDIDHASIRLDLTPLETVALPVRPVCPHDLKPAPTHPWQACAGPARYSLSPPAIPPLTR